MRSGEREKEDREKDDREKDIQRERVRQTPSTSASACERESARVTDREGGPGRMRK